ncbi:TadE/TadG family type IV pilus assembly protein [Alkalibacillus aidingensis]|uniref:TadE/TadG family type IV pilus assembly protein n=1 Tax=Alkalibacillus aidingensis TaxID=2747607 RepID=UPI001660567D|nr:TadE/TadG family type IV pilus assembly protein [Alkalibacillus aidingensis]
MFFKRFFKRERGQTVVLAAISLTGMLAMLGLVIDGGMYYVERTHLQKAANAAALSGAQELTTEDERIVRGIVDDTLTHHDELDALSGVIILLDERVTVELERQFTTTFMSLFGIDSFDVNVQATARLGTMGRAIGAAPLGIEESIEIVPGEEYVLKVDEGEVDIGNFGVLALEGPGARTYKENLLEGFQEELSVGDVVNTQTGNIAGPTKEATDILINSCDNMYERDCKRVLLVPVYQPYSHDNNQLKQVKITGFAYFYITEPMNDKDKTVKGVFIERAGSGFELEEAVDRGAFTVRLSE